MPYIAREDGVRFIIPSYRDTLVAKKPGLLKREITLLSGSYGEFITLQKKGTNQYEVACSPDSGYLLGECIWQHFQRPNDMIYCEAVPNTQEAILVIVKSGSVYLDGSFPIDSIPEELVVFLSQQNNFDIYIYGDVPISQTPEDGKFAFEASSVKSFTVLEQPVFPTLVGIKAFQLQLVDTVLKSQGIGTLPTKQILIAGALLVCAWLGWTYISTLSTPEIVSFVASAPEDPLKDYKNALASPAPDLQLQSVLKRLTLVFQIPGWRAEGVEYVLNGDGTGNLKIIVTSQGIRTDTLFLWASKIDAKPEITNEGINLIFQIPFYNRLPDNKVYSLQNVIGTLIDALSYVIPGNNVQLSAVSKKINYMEAPLTITVPALSPTGLILLSNQFKGLPLTLSKISLKRDNSGLSGTITLKALGN